MIIRSFKRGFLKSSPVLYISSPFGYRKINGKLKYHYGIDIACAVGTVLTSPYDARVIDKKLYKKGGGLQVKIRYMTNAGYSIDILFCHMNSIKDKITVGYKLSEGEEIGTTGGAKGDPNAGNSTGPHLHISVYKGVVPIDPMLGFLKTEKIILKKTNSVLNEPSSDRFFDDSIFSSSFSAIQPISSNSVVEGETEDLSYKEVKPVNTSISERFAPGIWQIIKLLVDDSVMNKQVVDAGISVMTGSLLNFFNKVCQQPLVEFFGDTYGDQYYFIVRRPPFDKEGFKRMIDSAMITIDSENIESANLYWNNDNIFSWYQYIPYFDYAGSKETSFLMPAVFFPEYASVWGSKPLTIQSNYYNYIFSGKFNNKEDKNKQVNSDNIAKNAYSDFRYLIESNAYSPFTRKGTITLANGDRRIKRGMLIYYTTGEVFYVDSVTNTYEIRMGEVTRNTVLSVSHGMYPEYIDGKIIDGKKYSYFNLIDFGKESYVNFSKLRSNISKWKVNVETFGFFMRREQVIRKL